MLQVFLQPKRAGSSRGPREIQLSAIVCRGCVIRSNSCCFFCDRDNNRSRLEKVLRLDYSLKKFCISFDRYAKKWLQERQKCEALSADRCFSLSMPYFFVFARAAGTFLLGCWAWYCHKFLQKNSMLLQVCHRRVDRERGDIYSSMNLRICSSIYETFHISLHIHSSRTH